MRRNIFDQNIVHCLFDIGHFQQLIGAASRTINLAFDVVRERGVVAFDPGGPQALQGVEQRFELEENLRRGISLQPEPAQELELAQHVNQRRVKGRIQ